MESKYDCLLIVGMHRSGTSMVAQACAAAGVNPGPAEDLLSAQSDNPEGFFEHRRLVEINDAMLDAAGASWFAPPAHIDLKDCAAQRQELVRALSSTESVFFLKDPRLCLTASAWLQVVPRACWLYVYRSPLAVARSLARRNHFSLQLGLQLWEWYNRRALEFLRDHNFVAVSYDALAAGEVSIVDLLIDLQRSGLDCDPSAAADVFRPSLQHFAGDDDEELVLLTEEQRQLHQACQAVCANDGEVVLPFAEEHVLLARLHDNATALTPLARTVETALERDDALALVAERTRERDNSLGALQTLERDHEALVQAHESEKTSHQQAAAVLADLENDHQELARAHEAEKANHAKLVALHDELHREFDERGEALRDLYADRDRLTDELGVLQSEHAALQDKADYLFFSLTESYRSLLSFELSTMARLQRQLRRIYRLLTGQRGRNSAYEDVLERAHEHFAEFELELPRRQPGKLSMAGDVLRYVWHNPAGSARSFSWTRLRRAASVFFRSSPADLAVWVDARFPERSDNENAFDPDALDPALDQLELEFAPVDAPRVSIIIPVYNDYRMTVSCLASVHRYTEGVDYEVIIGDDCSTDLTTSIAERMRGVIVSRTPENQRFLRNCNLAASRARGEFLVFLNNDTHVTEGWLNHLLAPFVDITVGVTGPKLLFGDGRLQEAGGIIWRDASGWNFGRADDPDKPAYNYRRDVDYVSGACLAIRRSLWSELGGFDEAFVPAYYEDADICFAARAAGYRVVYEPRSVIHHFEGVSNGTDLSAGVKQYQVVNQATFRNKWAGVLDREHFPNAERVIHARDRSAGRRCVLVIDHYVPHHDRDAGGRSTFMYLKLLVEQGYRVQFMGANFFPHQPYTQALQAMGIEVLVGETIARHLDRWLVEHAPYIDEVFVHRPHVAEQFLPHLERMDPKPTIGYVGHDLHYLRIEREAALKDDDGLRREAERWRKRELAVMDRVDRVYYFSPVEIDELARQVPLEKLRQIPLYAMQIDALPQYAPSHVQDVLFVGGYGHPPNVDAATWLVDEILPRVHETLPAATLHLVGSNPPDSVRELAGDTVTVHGYVTDEELAALYRRVGAAIVPLRYGAGVKGKVIEAIAAHVPLVTTEVGAEGIPDCEAVMWIENTAEHLAQRLVAILSGEENIEARLGQHEDWLATHFDTRRAAEVLARDLPPAVASR